MKAAATESTDTRRPVDHNKAAISRMHLTISTPYVEPNGPTELALARMWSEVLQVDQIGRDDDFFELGGDSYAATVLAGEIEHAFDIQFSPADFIALATITQQANKVDTGRVTSTSSPQPSFMTACRPEGKLRPLFIVHGARGFTFFDRRFLDELGDEQPVYLFQAPGMDGRTKPLATVPDYAAAYLGAMRTVQPNGPYLLASLCSGSLIGLEMCRQLYEARESVAVFILIDPSIVPRALAHLYPAVSKDKSLLWGTVSTKLERLRFACINFVHGKGFNSDPTMADWRKELRRVNRMHARILENVAVRRGKGESVAPPVELTYSVEDVLNTCLALSAALRAYVPAPYRGHGHMLLNEIQAPDYLRNDLFWKSHLASFDYELCPGTHQDVFDRNVLNTAAFVKRRLANWTDPSPI